MSNTVFAAKNDGDDLVLDVFDTIGRDWMGEGVTAKAIAKALADSPKSKRVVVRINSPGGEVFEGNTIVSLLKESGKTIRTEVHGLAASMGSIIALAGDEIVMAEGSLMMIHNPWGFAMGDARDMRQRADMLDKIREGMLDRYAGRAHLSRSKISDMMDAETWMSPTEAVKNGFADSVMGKVEDADRAEMRLHSGLTKDDASAIVAALRQSDRPMRAAVETPARDGVVRMQDESKVPEVPAIDMVPRADYDALVARVATLVAAQDAKDKVAHAERVDAAITAALTAGKIVPASEAYHRGCCASAEGLAAFLAYVDSVPSIVAPAPIPAAAEEASAKPAPLTPAQIKLCKQFNLSEDDFRAAMLIKPIADKDGE